MSELAENIRFVCPSCQQKLSGPARLAGQRRACPKCGDQIDIPSFDAPEYPATGEPATADPATPDPATPDPASQSPTRSAHDDRTQAADESRVPPAAHDAAETTGDAPADSPNSNADSDPGADAESKPDPKLPCELDPLNPVDAAQALLDLLDGVSEQVNLGEKLRERLSGVRERVELVIVDLKEIHDLVPLQLEQGPDLKEAYGIWNDLPEGRIGGGTETCRQLIDSSETLRAMHQAGIDIVSLEKFNQQQLDLANAIGQSFSAWHETWDRFKIGLGTDTQRPVKVQKKDFQEALDFFNVLERFKVLEDFSLEFFIYRGKKWKQTDAKRVRHLKSETQPIRFLPGDFNSDFTSFIQGHWLNAYAYSLIDDHLRRNNLEYELYSLVQYKAPPEIIRDSGDFDVLARAGDKIVLIECKAGRLRQNDERQGFDSIVAKAEGLQRVFDMTRADIKECMFLLLYNPFLSQEESVNQALDGSIVEPVKLEEIRGTLMDCFGRS